MNNEAYTNFNPDAMVPNFLTMKKEELEALALSNGFSFTADHLIFIQNYFKSAKGRAPTYNQLRLFDSINKIRISKKNDFSIYKATANCDTVDYIIETSKDLLQKRSVCQKKNYSAMPLSVAATVASDYHKYIGTNVNVAFFRPPSSAPHSNYCIHTGNKKPLLYLYEPSEEASKAPSGAPNATNKNAFVLLSPIGLSSEEYTQKALEFIRLGEIKNAISEHTVINGDFGILDVLVKETNGIYINLSAIPELERDTNGKVIDLSALVYACKERHIFTVTSTSVAMIDRIAREYGLCASILAIRNPSGLLETDVVKSPYLSVSFDFLRAFMSFKEFRAYTFSQENKNAPDKAIPIYLTDETAPELRSWRAEKILKFNKVITTATARELISSPFRTSAITVIDAITALVSKGVPKSSITLSIAYSLLGGTDDTIELGKNLAAILGSYRSMIELCVSDNEPIISYDSARRSIVCVAYAPNNQKNFGNSFCGNGEVYFLPLRFTEDGCPDYTLYRDSLNLFCDLIDRELILSAFPINENLKAVISNASQSITLTPTEDFFAEEFTLSHGILFEKKNVQAKSSELTRLAIKIGSTLPIA